MFTREDEFLLMWWDTFFVLDLGLDVLDGVGGLDVEDDDLSFYKLEEDLHTAAFKFLLQKGLLLRIGCNRIGPLGNWCRMSEQLLISSERSSVSPLLGNYVVTTKRIVVDDFAAEFYTH